MVAFDCCDGGRPSSSPDFHEGCLFSKKAMRNGYVWTKGSENTYIAYWNAGDAGITLWRHQIVAIQATCIAGISEMQRPVNKSKPILRHWTVGNLAQETSLEAAY